MKTVVIEIHSVKVSMCTIYQWVQMTGPQFLNKIGDLFICSGNVMDFTQLNIKLLMELFLNHLTFTYFNFRNHYRWSIN